MLVDIEFDTTGPMANLMGMMCSGGQSLLTRLGQGFYQLNHFNLDNLIMGRKVVKWWRIDDDDERQARYDECDIIGYQNEYGVCDTPEQFMHRYGVMLAASPRHYVVSFTIVLKKDQYESGGWRWHKWGPYIGDKNPQHEYLYDEGPEITQATCFHVYELEPL